MDNPADNPRVRDDLVTRPDEDHYDNRDSDPDDDTDIDVSADGEPIDGTDDDIARMALADARSLTRGGARRGRSGESRRRTRQQNLIGRNRGGYSGPGHDPERDPQRIGALLPGYVHDLGWERPLADARVFAQWSELVGADVAAHCEPQSLRDGELRISAESTAWATQLRLLSATLLARLAAELGPQTVTKLSISGPVAPSWRHGPRSTYKGRGPRDTYG